ncbi:hypothetical protein MPSEU_000712200 [Mayamaea pseudoterrestris]|nr:hypothetical protein MPSEU_000712200 [Mayamaea pseudoterrestris]
MASSSASNAAATMAAYWSDDFRPLQDAGQAIRKALREDEAAADADIYRKLTDPKGKHLYFPATDDTERLVKHRRSVPLPQVIVEELKSVKKCSFMGILAPASLVWVTCDNRLFLWPFEKQAGTHTFEANAPIITVGLVKPNKDFMPSVEWILVVTTPDEIMQLLLYKSDDDAAFKVRASSFNLPTDNVRMLSVVGTECGRIFLGGEDGCLYEIVYQNGNAEGRHRSEEELLAAFYDKGEDIGETIYLDGASSITGTIVTLGKRSLGFNGSRGSQRPQKCRKLNRSSSSWASAILPDVLTRTADWLFGGKTATGGGPIVKIVVDESRHTLYTLSRDGSICSFALRSKGSVQLAAVIKTPQKVTQYLEAVGRGQMNPPIGGSAGYISFNGNGQAAQAGVGGMEGARAILKQAELQANKKALVPISIHVISPTESQQLTLLAVTKSGLRLYLSSISSKLTLCHVRAAPPTDQKPDLASLVDDSGFVGGLKPRIQGSDKAGNVDASLYKDGVFMTARESGASQVGDAIIAAYPGPTFRKLEVIAQDGDDQEELWSAPGGIVETISLPMQASGSGPVDNPSLPGGIVVDMAQVSCDDSVAMKLAKNSLTPSDSELGSGLPAEYTLPSKARPHRPLGTQSDETITSIVVRDRSLSGGIVSLMTTLLPNTVFANAVRKGVAVPGLDAGRAYAGKASAPSYRISGRDGKDGFSLTAAEKMQYVSQATPIRSRGKQITTKSVRLRQWLLKPPMVPLHQLATQQYSAATKDVIALNAGGLHIFNCETVLLSLADVLSSAGENVKSDPNITVFFKKYGNKEGCAMCLSLAAGCGPVSTQSLRLRERAWKAALANSFSPKLVLKENDATNGATGYSSNIVDSIVPKGYKFVPSRLAEGLTALISRLLRPFWFKPAVVVTEGRVVKSAWSRDVHVTPPKVELLVSSGGLKQIRERPADLLQVMKKLSHAVATVPGVSQDQTSMDFELEGDNFITNAISYQHQSRAYMNGSDHIISDAELERLARLMEERNIHSLYRLLSRAVQVLNLLLLLYKAEDITELNEVEWGLLHGLTFSQLVETRDGQDRVERLLNSLITASAADGFGKVAPSVLVDQIASQFSEQCYSYFTPGSRSAFLGFLRANEALENAAGSSRRALLTNQAGNHFRDAAKHWVNASLITGRILHSKGQESYSEVASRAFQCQSPLARASDLLIRLGDIATAVDICLVTALNFQKNDSSTAKSTWSAVEKSSTNVAYPWELQLYRKQFDAESGNGNPTSASSRSVAGGISVTAGDAVDTCFSLVFYYFAALMDSDPAKAYTLASACTAATDRAFLHRFFSFLKENGYVETLLMIDTPVVEEWIKETGELELLWRYYDAQNRSLDAGEVSLSRARNSKSPVPLDDRIEFLSRAVNAFRLNLERSESKASFALDDGTQKAITLDRERLNFARETLCIARIQKRVLHAIDSRRQAGMKIDCDSNMHDRVTSELVDASDLYNEYTTRLYLFDFSLLILHACKHDDPAEIQRLWINLIAEEFLPCATRDIEVHSRLESLLSNIGQADDVQLLGPNESTNSLRLFEDGDWSTHVETRIIGLGEELYGTGADFVFPVNYLLDVLEGTSRFSCFTNARSAHI